MARVERKCLNCTNFQNKNKERLGWCKNLKIKISNKSGWSCRQFKRANSIKIKQMLQTIKRWFKAS